MRSWSTLNLQHRTEILQLLHPTPWLVVEGASVCSPQPQQQQQKQMVWQAHWAARVSSDSSASFDRASLRTLLDQHVVPAWHYEAAMQEASDWLPTQHFPSRVWLLVYT